METALKIQVASNEFDLLFSELCENIKGNPRLLEKILDLGFDVSKFLVKILRINSDDSAARTGELIVRFDPADFLRMLCIALRTSQVDSLILEHGKMPPYSFLFGTVNEMHQPTRATCA